MEDEFDWSDVESETLFQSVGAVAVYENPHGDIVIRQQAVGYGDEDKYVVVPVKYLDTIIAKLEQVRLGQLHSSRGDE